MSASWMIKNPFTIWYKITNINSCRRLQSLYTNQYLETEHCRLSFHINNQKQDYSSEICWNLAESRTRIQIIWYFHYFQSQSFQYFFINKYFSTLPRYCFFWPFLNQISLGFDHFLVNTTNCALEQNTQFQFQFWKYPDYPAISPPTNSNKFFLGV